MWSATILVAIRVKLLNVGSVLVGYLSRCEYKSLIFSASQQPPGTTSPASGQLSLLQDDFLCFTITSHDNFLCFRTTFSASGQLSLLLERLHRLLRNTAYIMPRDFTVRLPSLLLYWGSNRVNILTLFGLHSLMYAIIK